MQNNILIKDFFPNITIEVAEKNDWVKIVNEQGKVNYIDLYDAFCKKAEQAKKEGKKENSEFYMFLTQIFLIYFVKDNPKQPYAAMMNFNKGRTAIITDFTEKNLNVIKSLIGKSNISFVDARFADILWLRYRKREFADIAFDNFINHTKHVTKLLNARKKVDSSKPNDNAFLYSSGEESFERACQIWNQLGKPKEQFKDIFVSLKDIVDFNMEESPYIFRINFLKIFVKYNIYDSIESLEEKKTWLSECKKLSFQLISKNKFERARNYLEIAIEMTKSINDEEGVKELKRRCVDSYVTQARNLRESGIDAIVLIEPYENAIKACKNHGGLKKLIDELHSEMNEISKNIKFKKYSIKMDVTPIVKKTQKFVQENVKSDKDIIEIISAMAEPPKKEDLRRSVEQVAKESRFSHLTSKKILNEKNRIIARSLPINTSDKEGRDEGIRSEMIMRCSQHINLRGLSSIELARKKLENRADSDIFKSLVEKNPFVPTGREQIFIDGFKAGLKGEYLVCTHLLIPQIENSIRIILERKGLLPKLKEERKKHKEQKEQSYIQNQNDFIQEEHNLNKILYYPDAKTIFTIFGEDMVFCLQALLVEKYGGNYRNKLAHGLIEYSDFFNGWSNFLWAMTIRLCYFFQSADKKQNI